MPRVVSFAATGGKGKHFSLAGYTAYKGRGARQSEGNLGSAEGAANFASGTEKRASFLGIIGQEEGEALSAALAGEVSLTGALADGRCPAAAALTRQLT